MANTCALGRTQFAKHCKDLTNMSPIEYLLSCRIQRAAVLLTQDLDMSITDVSGACGFDSSQYFSNAFRKSIGNSPRKYRETQRCAVGALAPHHRISQAADVPSAAE
ncbi:helix-turn-helix transcriptional regulator [Devosia algicola]|uniref:helix-turn-helix transcriptional regulator n=1 Tax=Devosia algicola TaxID=3026418 RepID=UPI003899574A